MKKFLLGAGLGYVLGAKAGRGRYEQLVRTYRRVVGGARIDPGAAKPDELIHMVESATFTGADKP